MTMFLDLLLKISDPSVSQRQTFLFGFYYFTHFELSQLLGRAKMGDPQEKPPDHPQAELGLSHMWPELGSNP